MKERLLEFLKHLRIGQGAFEKRVGLSNGFVNNIGDSIRKTNLEKISKVYPELNIAWLQTGIGEMLKTNETDKSSDNLLFVPLLPIAAQGGGLNDFVVSVKDSDCEMVVSPVKGADFAITVAGDSMAPEYPAGSQILIKRINEQAFIEWGKVYVLDTCNGSIIKKVMPSKKEHCIKCLSINPAPEYAPFEVCKDDIYGVYRVLMCMSIK